MGAINKNTNKYEYPAIALKSNTYSCPKCERDVILKKGEIKAHHFAHYCSDNPCGYYNHPGESDIHKDAKLLLKVLLENRANICINKKCVCCQHTLLINQKYTENATIIDEHKFQYNNSTKKADVACLDSSTIQCIYEIYYTHKTKDEHRPEPWYEIDAQKLLCNSDIMNNHKIINLYCIRKYKCNNCIERELREQIIRQQEYEKRREEDERSREEYEKRRKESEKQRYENERARIESEERHRIEAKRIEAEKMKKVKERQEQFKREQHKIIQLSLKEDIDRKKKLEQLMEETKKKMDEQQTHEHKHYDFIGGFSEEERNNAYSILDGKISHLRKDVYLRYTCAKCKTNKCKKCLDNAQKQFILEKVNLPKIADILKELYPKC